MSQLTTTSKILIVTGCVAFLILLRFGCYSCTQGCNRQQQYNQTYQQPAPVYYPPQQPQYQTVIREDGSSFVMNYLLYRSLMDQGGPNVVNNYYDSHRNEPEFQPQRQQQYRQEAENEVRTQQSSGFGSKPTQTQPSNGFGSKPVETNKSKGFGTYSSPTPPPSNNVQTQRSNGFGNISLQKPVTTEKSVGFGERKLPVKVEAPKTAKTNSSKGFGKKN